MPHQGCPGGARTPQWGYKGRWSRRSVAHVPTGDGEAPLDPEVTPVDRQLFQIGDEGLHEGCLHVGVHRSLVGNGFDEVQDRLVAGIDGHDARPSEGFDIGAELDHSSGKLCLLSRLRLEPNIDVDRLAHRVLSHAHQGFVEEEGVGPSGPTR